MKALPIALSALLLALPAARAATVTHHASSSHHSYLRVDDDTLDWQRDGRALRLHDTGAGVAVTAVQPDGWLGLHDGDVIAAVDGRATSRIAQMRQQLAGLGDQAARLAVRAAGGARREVRLAHDDYAPWLPGAPMPVPPAPPPPPAPPVR